MKKEFLNFLKKFLEHIQQGWKYKQEVWKKEYEDMQLQRQHQQQLEYKQRLFNEALVVQNELFCAWHGKHYQSVHTINNFTDLSIKRFEPVQNSIVFSVRLTTLDSVKEYAVSLQRFLNEDLRQLKKDLEHQYQYNLQDAYMCYPYIMNGLRVVNLQQDGMELLITVQLKNPFFTS